MKTDEIPVSQCRSIPFSARGTDAAWPHHALLTGFVFFWGGNFVLAEIALREMAPIAFSVSRFAVGAGAMIAILYAQTVFSARRGNGTDQLFPRVRSGDWPRLILVAILGATLAPWLGIEGLALTHGARASLWLALGPALSCALGALLRTERLGAAGYLGVAFAGLGTFALAFDGIRPGQDFWFGDLLLLLALLLAVAELHLIKPLAARYGATPMVTARTVIGGLVYFLIASPTLAVQPWLTLHAWTWVAILAGGAVGVGIGQWVKVRALRRLGPTRVVLYGNLVPLAALALAWLLIGTQSSTLEVVAAVLIVLGAICIQVVDFRTVLQRDMTDDGSDDFLETVVVRSGDG